MLLVAWWPYVAGPSLAPCCPTPWGPPRAPSGPSWRAVREPQEGPRKVSKRGSKTGANFCLWPPPGTKNWGESSGTALGLLSGVPKPFLEITPGPLGAPWTAPKRALTGSPRKLSRVILSGGSEGRPSGALLEPSWRLLLGALLEPSVALLEPFKAQGRWRRQRRALPTKTAAKNDNEKKTCPRLHGSSICRRRTKSL